MSTSDEIINSDKRNEALLAKAIIQRHAKEDDLRNKSEGLIWLQYLPILAAGIFVILSVSGMIQISPWNLATLCILQITLWSVHQRIDAVLRLNKSPSDSPLD